METFSQRATHPARALQAWQILISAAMNRQTHTYRSLSVLMYEKQAQGVLAQILSHIAYFCNENQIPPLTALVVNEQTGLPGDKIPTGEDLNAIRERVYAFNWYNVYPPTENQLKEIYEKSKS